MQAAEDGRNAICERSCIVKAVKESKRIRFFTFFNVERRVRVCGGGGGRRTHLLLALVI